MAVCDLPQAAAEAAPRFAERWNDSGSVAVAAAVPAAAQRAPQRSIPECECFFPYAPLQPLPTSSDELVLRRRLVFVEEHEVILLTSPCGIHDLDTDSIGLEIWPGTHVMARVILSLAMAGELEGRSVLDLGCGTGFLGILARKAGCSSVVLADRDATVREAASLSLAANAVDGATVHDISWTVGEEADTTGDEMFDLLIMSELLYVAAPTTVPWTLDDSELLALAKVAKAKLRPGGTAWVSYGNRESGGDEQFQIACEAHGLKMEQVPLEQVLPEEELQLQGAHALHRVMVFKLCHSDDQVAASEERSF